MRALSWKRAFLATVTRLLALATATISSAQAPEAERVSIPPANRAFGNSEVERASIPPAERTFGKRSSDAPTRLFAHTGLAGVGLQSRDVDGVASEEDAGALSLALELGASWGLLPFTWDPSAKDKRWSLGLVTAFRLLPSSDREWGLAGNERERWDLQAGPELRWLVYRRRTHVDLFGSVVGGGSWQWHQDNEFHSVRARTTTDYGFNLASTLGIMFGGARHAATISITVGGLWTGMTREVRTIEGPLLEDSQTIRDFEWLVGLNPGYAFTF